MFNRGLKMVYNPVRVHFIASNLFYQGLIGIVRLYKNRKPKEESMKNVKSIGGFLFVMGVGSAILTYFGYEFRLLMWIDTWGPQAGWAIRGAMAAVGAVLWFIGFKNT